MARHATAPLILFALCSGCGEPPPEPPVPTTLDVSPDSLNFEALAVTAALAATVYDQHGRVMTEVAVSWRSSGGAVAAVDRNGVVTATGNGTAFVAAMAEDAGDSARVAVEQRPVSLGISPAGPLGLEAIGDTLRLAAQVLDPNDQPIVGAVVMWVATDTTIVTVDREGLVTAVDNGAAAIHATSGRLADTVSAVVEQVPVEVRISPADDPLTFGTLGDTVRLSAQVLDSNGHPVAGVHVAWSTSDTSVATVDGDGLVAARGNGTATVSASAQGLVGSIQVEVDQVPVVIDIFSPTDLLAIGDSIRMTAEAFDAGGSLIEGARFSWTSSDTAVATAKPEGWVRALAEGSVDITAGFKGLSASVSLTTATPDKTALLALFRSANGESWSTNTNWGTDAALAEWHGVEIDDLGRVEYLTLSQNNLAGTIPAEIGKLAGLKELHLEVNLLEGALPPEIGKLASLQWLGLYANELSGPLPAEIGDLSDLRVLDLAFNSFTGSLPAEVTQLPQLRYLGLFFNELTGRIPPEIGDLSLLRVLDLCYNRLTGPIPPEIGRLARLERLWLCGIDTNPTAGNRLSGRIPPEIGDLANLTALNLGANRLSGPVPPEIGRLAKLDSLALYSNLLTRLPPELGELGNLEYLSAYGNRLTGAIPTGIGDLAKLHTLLLGRGHTSGDNNLTGAIPGELGDLAKLERLDLGANDLTGGIPSELGRLSRLEFLELGSNNLTGKIPWELGGLTRLTRLAVCPNQLSGPIPKELGKLGELYYMFLCSNDLTGPLPPEFGDLANLRFLYLGSNRLTGEIPETMLELKRLLEFLWARNDGLCAPKTEEFEEWLDSIPSSSDIYCESASMEMERARIGETGGGGCSVTVVAAPSAATRLGRGRHTAPGFPPGRPTEHARVREGVRQLETGAPGIRVTRCGDSLPVGSNGSAPGPHPSARRSDRRLGPIATLELSRRGPAGTLSFVHSMPRDALAAHPRGTP